MSAHTNYFRLGLFVILTLAALTGVVIILGALRLGTPALRYHSYFDESVHGLEPGAPVKFRGVKVGSVAAIDIAPDHRHVDVVSELEAKEAERVGLALSGRTHAAPPDLRAQLATQGLTGIKFLSLDLFDPARYPPPELPFLPPENTIPTVPSLIKSIEDVLAQSTEHLPETMDAMRAVMTRADRLLETLERADLGPRAAGALDELHTAANKATSVLARVDGEDGLVASAKRATDALGDVGRNGRRTQRELEATLRDLRTAADAVRSLAFAIERDPEMLLKGKARGKGFE